MSITPVAVGAKSNIVVDYETSYGVAPAAGWRRSSAQLFFGKALAGKKQGRNAYGPL